MKKIITIVAIIGVVLAVGIVLLKENYRTMEKLDSNGMKLAKFKESFANGPNFSLHHNKFHVADKRGDSEIRRLIKDTNDKIDRCVRGTYDDVNFLFDSFLIVAVEYALVFFVFFIIFTLTIRHITKHIEDLQATITHLQVNHHILNPVLRTI